MKAPENRIQTRKYGRTSANPIFHVLLASFLVVSSSAEPEKNQLFQIISKILEHPSIEFVIRSTTSSSGRS
ncbi:hypothetical protein BCR34DRAFT_573328 [Clohesyomyces aquaticus]|uniref:Uncharacterized protein n=1 Tax=Clohesyomyces aquaticus TaxID=1231657 RepID=A0A1Y1Z040_9PLEO|nr:hypothetical protein BCR34DRAFT_573328 [Clohesyomyces aquaticus]